MKTSKKLLASAVAASVLSLSAIAPVAQAEVSASLAIATAYHWRGFELGSGTPALSGDLVFSEGGFSAGMWASSGDTAGGTEYDFFAGYEFSAGDFSAGLTVISYVYPTGGFRTTDGSPGDFMEAIVSLGYGPVSFNYHDNIAGETGGYAFDEDYSYWKLAASFENGFGIAVGSHDEGDIAPVTGNATHLDLSYAYNDNLSFTLSTIVDSDEPDAGFVEPEPFFVISYGITID